MGFLTGSRLVGIASAQVGSMQQRSVAGLTLGAPVRCVLYVSYMVFIYNKA